MDILDLSGVTHIIVRVILQRYAMAMGAFNKIKGSSFRNGLRTYNKYSPYPEEMNRTLVSKISDIHLPYRYCCK